MGGAWSPGIMFMPIAAPGAPAFVNRARSAPVYTATTPGSALAADTSTATRRPCGTVLRLNAACSIPGSEMSSM